MSSSRSYRSPLSIADEVFTALVTGPEPLSLDLRPALNPPALNPPAPHPGPGPGPHLGGVGPVGSGPRGAHPGTTAGQDAPSPGRGTHTHTGTHTGTHAGTHTGTHTSVLRPAPTTGEPGPAGVVVPVDRVRDLLCQAATSLQVKNRVWSLLVGHSQRHGGAWTVAAVGVALAPLVRLATELAAGNPEGHDGRADLDSEILAGFLHALATIGLATTDPATTALFPHLMRAARRGGLAWLRHQRGADIPLDAQFGSAPPPRPWGHPDLVLSDAVSAGVLSAGEAALIGATRLDRLPVAVYATRIGDSLQAVWKRRRRAELRLSAWITARGSDTDHTDDPTSAHALNTIPCRTGSRAAGRAGPTRPPVGGSGTGRGVRCPASSPASPSYPRADSRPDTEAAA